jgi:DNA-binding NarL/FixJ family response regulator
MEIIDLVKKGYTSKEIAEVLVLEARDMATHREHILKKLRLKNSEILGAYFHRNFLEFQLLGW